VSIVGAAGYDNAVFIVVERDEAVGKKVSS
jgi:hypothetical protein